ncbi:MAG: hypothetical protein P4L99_17195 [Chthoniobacter sp.]|nr:hypothetical protein [Chthoniobacter sp.]
MANRKTLEKKTEKKPLRRTRNVKLSPDQVQSLIGLWNEFHGGAPAFAEEMARVENPDAENLTAATSAKLRGLHRIEDGDIGVSQDVFKTIAGVLEITTEDLKAKLSAPTLPRVPSDVSGPWVTDEAVLSRYRTVFHCYYQTKQADDIFWVYTPIDFTTPRQGYLHASHRIGLGDGFEYELYGYLFREMLVIISKSNEEGNEREAVSLHFDIRKPNRAPLGHFGVFINEDRDGAFGVGGYLLFRDTIVDKAIKGRQSPTVSKLLNEYWRVLGGQSCNRILHLFEQKPYFPRPGAWKRLQDCLTKTNLSAQ